MLFPEKTCQQLIKEGSLTPEIVEGKIYKKIEGTYIARLLQREDEVDLAGLYQKVLSHEKIPEHMEYWACAAWNIHMFIVEDTAEIEQFTTEQELETFMEGLYKVFKEIWLGIEHPPCSAVRVVFDWSCGEIYTREALMLQKFPWLG